MKIYFASRALVAAALAALMALSGLVWWAAGAAGLLVFIGFILLARSGRYVVQPQGGPAPLRRDERGREINQRAGLHGFVTLSLGVGGLTFYYGALIHSSVPVGQLVAVLSLGLAAYILSDYWLRKL